MKRKTKRQKLITIIGFAALLIAALVVYIGRIELPFLPDHSRYTTAEVNVQFLDVGQGDCALIQDHDKTVLIDGGVPDQGTSVLYHLEKQGIKKIDIMIGSHPHSDHIGGLVEVLKRMPTSMLILPGIPESLTPTTKVYTDLLKTASEKNVTVKMAKVGDVYPLSRGNLEILGPVKEYTDLDNESIIAKFTDRNNSFLFTGDAKATAEKDLLASGENLKSLVLKVGHHGSNTSSTKDFLAAVNPKCCVISVGKDNSYGHPSKSVLDRLAENPDRKVYRTDVDRTVIVESDGNQIKIKTRKDS